MRRTLSILALLMLFVASAGFVHASAFSTVFTAIDNEILPNETAEFEVTISNFGSSEQKFQIYTIDPNWVVKISPVNVRVPAKSSKTFILTLRPKTNVPLGSQGISINIKNLENNALVRKRIYTAVKSYDEVRGIFLPSVSLDIGLAQLVHPQNPTQFSVQMRNRNPLDIRNMTLAIASPHFSHTEVVTLDPLGEKTEYFTLDLSAQETPGLNSIHATLSYNGKVISQVKREYTIMAFSNVEQQIQEKVFLFKKTRIITLTNEGNSAKEVTASLPANFLSRLFSTTIPTSNYEGGLYSWKITVPPNDTISIELTANYRWLLGTLVMILLAVFLYFWFRSPVVVLKEVVCTIDEGSTSHMKIRLFIRNRSNKVIQGVEVMDKVPKICQLIKSHTLGTIKPTKVSQLKSGTLIRWDLDILEPFEERILTYTLESSLKIVGKVNPPRAKVKFDTGKNQERIVESSNVVVNEK